MYLYVLGFVVDVVECDLTWPEPEDARMVLVDARPDVNVGAEF
jgi:hypothetical protein